MAAALTVGRGKRDPSKNVQVGSVYLHESGNHKSSRRKADRLNRRRERRVALAQAREALRGQGDDS